MVGSPIHRKAWLLLTNLDNIAITLKQFSFLFNGNMIIIFWSPPTIDFSAWVLTCQTNSVIIFSKFSKLLWHFYDIRETVIDVPKWPNIVKRIEPFGHTSCQKQPKRANVLYNQSKSITCTAQVLLCEHAPEPDRWLQATDQQLPNWRPVSLEDAFWCESRIRRAAQRGSSEFLPECPEPEQCLPKVPSPHRERGFLVGIPPQPLCLTWK